ncbi:MAG: succinate dehydrogenase, partial [Flavobacterium sp.]|nr:succinate dehydrogenase [Flavobacterium sp.]
AFIFLHMGDFWYKMKFTDQLAMATYDGVTVKDLYQRVPVAYQQTWIVAAYIIGLIVLAFHLWHGFQSAFQSLGVNSSKITPIIKFVGKAFSIIVPILFAIIPIFLHFKK